MGRGLARVGECRTLEDLQGDGLRYVDLDYEVKAVEESVGKTAEGSSAFVVRQVDGEMVEAWASDSGRPFEMSAWYTRVH